MPTNEVYIPQLKIELDGTLLADTVMDHLKDVIIDSSLGVSDMFTLTFFDDNLTLINDSSYVPQKQVKVSLTTSTGTLTSVMEGEITSVEPIYGDGTFLMRIHGYDKSHKLNRGTKYRAFRNVQHSDIVISIAGEYGFQVSATSTGVVYPVVMQDNISDRDFLEQLARINGARISITGTTFKFDNTAPSESAGTLTVGEDLYAFRPRLSSVGQVSQVTVKGWDSARKEAIVGVATAATNHPTTGITRNGGTTEAGSAKYMFYHPQATNTNNAEKIAKGILNDIDGGFLTAEGECLGNPAIVAGKKVTIAGMGSRFNGDYMVTSATHYYTSEGYETHFRIEGLSANLIADYISGGRVGTHSSGMWNGVVPAIVTNVDDSEKDIARIKVKFPWLDDAVESDWARYCGMGASNQSGFYWLPNVNDEVLVAFEHGDFNRPYVIGSLWNMSDKPPEPIGSAFRNGRVALRTLKTPAGHIIRLNDESGQEKIEILVKDNKVTIVADATGKLEINTEADIVVNSKAKTTVTSTQDISVTTNTGNVTIKGTNVTIEATAALKLKGATADLQAAGITNVKGSLVNIN